MFRQPMDFEQQIKIPKDRVAVVIGTDGKQKDELEDRLQVSLDVDSTEGEVHISGSDALCLYVAQEVIKAIGRGFNPDIALQLQKTDYMFELINITDYVRSKNQMMRMKGRVIGQGGKSRETIEQLTDTRIVIYGKTIGVIGDAEGVQAAKKGIDMLLTGAPHANVFRILERWRRDQKRREIMGEA